MFSPWAQFAADFFDDVAHNRPANIDRTEPDWKLCRDAWLERKRWELADEAAVSAYHSGAEN